MAALRTAYTFAAANQSRFYGVHGGDSPTGGWAGVWSTGARGYIGFLRPGLEKLLREDGHDPGAVLRQWREAGWIRTWDKDRLEVRVTAWGGTRVAVVSIPDEALRKSGVGTTDARSKSDAPEIDAQEAL